MNRIYIWVYFMNFISEFELKNFKFELKISNSWLSFMSLSQVHFWVRTQFWVRYQYSSSILSSISVSEFDFEFGSKFIEFLLSSNLSYLKFELTLSWTQVNLSSIFRTWVWFWVRLSSVEFGWVRFWVNSLEFRDASDTCLAGGTSCSYWLNSARRLSRCV